MKKFLLIISFAFFLPFFNVFGEEGEDFKSSATSLYECEDDLVEIMFTYESRVRLRSGSLIDLSTDATAGIDQVLTDVSWHTWYRMSDVPEATIDQWQVNGESNTGMEVYNLNNIYRIQVPKGIDIWEFSVKLEALPGVILAKPVPKPVEAPLPPDYQSLQGYLNPSSSTPTGIDALYAWTQTGGTGTGITVCDLEYSWNYNHADITKAVGAQINTNVQDPFNDTNHGTAVIGELVADNNGWGTTGICYNSGLKTCGTYYGIPVGWNVPGAISLSIANLSAGDVILLEQQWDYTGSGGYVPIEWWYSTFPSAQVNNPVYAAIVNAISNGIHVVEAGGNGNMNTDGMTWFGNSGAIIVGAGGAGISNDLQRLSFSSYGQRFDLQGWGENVFTTGYGTYYNAMGSNYYYTSTFNGTSSASPIVAGAVACASGYYIANVSATPPTPAIMRSHLVSWGTPQVFGPSGVIGPRPDLYRAIINFPPPAQNYDWGDCPDLPYPTLFTSLGANHQIAVGANIFLGFSVDAEQNGQPNATATGDDNDGNNDDDGVILTTVPRPGQIANVTITASIQGVLNAWWDFNNNGSWADPGEQIFTNQTLNPVPNLLTISIPASAVIGNTFARFRFSTQPNIQFWGGAPDGEVEDYMFWIDEPMENMDWGDAPDQPYPTLSVNNGANHMIDGVTYMGAQVDPEPDGQPDPAALGDDNDIFYPPPNDDEDGVNMPMVVTTGQIVNVVVVASVQGRLNAWVDFDLNGTWADPGEQIFTDVVLNPGNNNLTFTVPAGGFGGQSYARFRFSTQGGLTFTGQAPNGEVEDYELIIEEGSVDDYDWGDAPDSPYPTLSVNNGANHKIDWVTFMVPQAAGVPDGQPDPIAMGDDMDIFYPPPNDDEDGVILPAVVNTGSTANIIVIASVQGRLNAWVDFNINGSWADPGEQIFTNQLLNPGNNNLSFTVPAGGPGGQSFARFRFDTQGGLTFTGTAPDGEVEDYQLIIEEGAENFDWGDAPDQPYPTLSVNNGANHKLDGVTWLGNQVDPEPDGQPDPNALGDDNDILYPPPNDDEDGVTMPAVVNPGSTVNIVVVASVQGRLNAWVDFNINGSWGDPGEQIFTDVALNPGNNNLTFLVSPGAALGQSFARFRFDTQGGLSFTGTAPDGEVEDYELFIEEGVTDYDWGDAPDLPYPTLAVNNGANHMLDGITWLGNQVDPEPNGQPDPNALGDDNDILYPPPNDDEAGVTMPAVVNTGQTVNITVTASVQGRLNAWVDFNINGSWADPGEQIFTDVVLNPGANNLSFTVPAGGTFGQSFARFRFNTQGGLSFTGPAMDGEVEDYELAIEEGPGEDFDWGDAPDSPYPTVLLTNGARHKIDTTLFLGAQVDPEPNGQPDPNALGDDMDIFYPPPNDDEDGVNMPAVVNTGQIVNIVVVASNQGRLNAWVDFNINGSWGDPGEQIFTDVLLNPGANNLSFNVPLGSISGQSFARFRLNYAGGLTYTGPANDGEVEDYELIIEEGGDYDWGDAPDQPYPTLSVNNGANHQLDGMTWLGNQVDPEPDGQPDPNALGDDNDILYPPPNDDEDGVNMPAVVNIGSTVNIVVTASVQGLLNAWVDFNINGNWGDPGEQIFTDQALNPGANNLSFSVPAAGALGQSFARFRFDTQGGLSYKGTAPDGEVEDYELFIEEGFEEFDWGDAPDSPYPTLSVNNGARHILDYVTFLGNQVDPEPDGQPDPNALGDDLDILYPPPNDDEDGVSLLVPLKVGNTAGFNVLASVAGYLNVWIDFNGNGSWADPGEQVFTDQILGPGNNMLLFVVPVSAKPGMTFARFRFSTFPGIMFTGLAPDGEVEDHELNIEGELDYGDAPDLPYPTLYASNGARHLIDYTIFMGGSIDFDVDGQPDPNALGDDNDGNDDEDGVVMPSNVSPGQAVNLTVTVSATGFFNGWIDYNGNGSWADAGEQIFIDAGVNPGLNTFAFTIPASATIGNTFARFRYSTFQGLTYYGPAYDGEVEDYEVIIDYTYKWLQTPDLSDYGMDVDATWDMVGFQPPHVLADDFLCDITGPLDNITIWGSWYHDHIPFMSDPDGVMFTLSIHEDIPDSLSPTGYSMPGNVIWFRDFHPGEFTSFLYASNLAEGWFDPVQPYYEPFGDTQCWMYSFDLQPGEFIQEGTADIPKVYWLDVQAQPFDQDPECRFGWKTSVDHWNDNAVWGVGMEPYFGPWNELYHPATGEQLDMAFAISGSESPFILLDLTAFLEGPYNGSFMDNNLNINGVIPISQPYGSDPSAPWYYTGAEIVSSIPGIGIVDWVMIELRDATTPGGANSSTIISQKASFIKRNGSIVALDGASYPKFYVTPVNNLYIAVYQRNHLGVMSANTIIPVGNLYSYDFTTGAGQVYGGSNGHKDIGGGVWGLIGGDGKADGQVNNGDKNDVWAPQAGSSGYKSGDFNMDTQVNNGDKNDIWVPNVGRGSQIP
ncbi:MAG: hypothetical protein K8R53_00285 [Bacteroidales bacterium]|nr:hypothetical protein [Bacteroidales bacterium]